MTPAIAEVRVPIMLDRERTMIFDLNTMSKFEELTRLNDPTGVGRFYYDVVIPMFDAFRDCTSEVDTVQDGKPSKAQITDMRGLMRKVSMKDLQMLISAAVHEYDADDEPVWPLTPAQVGRHLRNMVQVPLTIQLVLSGHAANNPTRRELGEAPAAAQPQPQAVQPAAAADPKPSENGGGPPIVLQEAAFA